MNIIHLHRSDFKTAAWSGGTTTELFLYPEGGSYARRDFLFRISSATVELAESDFTPLPGVERYITPLGGRFTLTHPGVPPLTLTPGSVPYRFSGEIPTHCVGQATDFNLMLKGCTGRMALCRDSAPIHPGFTAFFAKAPTVFTLDGRRFALEQGELLAVFSRRQSHAAFDTDTLLCWVDV